MAKMKSLSKASLKNKAKTSVDRLDEDLLGPPALIAGESHSEYRALLGRVTALVGPQGILEQIWIRDVVDLQWETLRLRRLKAALLIAEHHKGIQMALVPMMGSVAFDLTRRALCGDEEAVQDVEDFLDHRRLTADHIMALTLEKKLEPVEGIDRLISSAEARRNNALREIDRHRAVLGAAVRKAVEETEDAEFTEVGAPEQPVSTVQ